MSEQRRTDWSNYLPIVGCLLAIGILGQTMDGVLGWIGLGLFIACVGAIVVIAARVGADRRRAAREREDS